ncbi:hypothetical protein APV28_2475 [Comamonas testosteroni]|nr:hypothetical protein APV28_2475 [Comamonas testosteroni]
MLGFAHRIVCQVCLRDSGRVVPAERGFDFLSDLQDMFL